MMMCVCVIRHTRNQITIQHCSCISCWPTSTRYDNVNIFYKIDVDKQFTNIYIILYAMQHVSTFCSADVAASAAADAIGFDSPLIRA